MVPSATLTLPRPAIVYPESDGKPMAENTKQLRWIVVLFGNIAALFREAVDVFVGADLFWYPEEGDDKERQAPDVLVVFGRPKGDRGSSRQWEEGNVPLTVVFEILSPSNTPIEMARKLAFYDEHGVEEYYVFDPDDNDLLAYVRGRAALRLVRHDGVFTSPRLGVRFDLTGPEMVVYNPDGTPFLSFEQLKASLDELKASFAQLRADRDQEQRLRLDAERRAARLAELSRKARRQQASPQELEELERLEDESSSPPA